MPRRSLEFGDLVRFTSEEMHGITGVVSEPISEERSGHVLINRVGYIVGVETSIEDVLLADESSKGFAQLAYNLIKLGSHVIEKWLL